MSKKQQRTLFPVLAAALLALGVVTFIAARSRAAKAKSASAPVADHTTSESPKPPEPPQSEDGVVTPQTGASFAPAVHISVHGDAVRPMIIHTWPGKILLDVDNKARADVSLEIQPAGGGQPAATVSVPLSLKRIRQLVNLPVGDYFFFDASRTKIRGELVVQPRQ